MQLLAILALFSAASAGPVSSEDAIGQEWTQFKLKHGKNYSSGEEEALRMQVFIDNRNKIVRHNAAAAEGLESYTLAMNEFGDLSHDEFVRMMKGYRHVSGAAVELEEATRSEVSNSSTDLPKSIDWRQKGYVTPVKSQAKCGASWAFSATGALEGQNFRKTGKLVSLSEQNLVDCSSPEGNMGCKGGLMEFAFKYVKLNKGIDTEESYPYEGQDGECRFSKAAIGATATGYVGLKRGSEEELTKAIAQVGPVSVALDSTSDSFQFYKSGVYYDKACSPITLDLGALAVGYGTDSDGHDYYIVKNAWGESWGEKGYIRMSRGRDNNCGIATSAVYPVV